MLPKTHLKIRDIESVAAKDPVYPLCRVRRSKRGTIGVGRIANVTLYRNVKGVAKMSFFEYRHGCAVGDIVHVAKDDKMAFHGSALQIGDHRLQLNSPSL